MEMTYGLDHLEHNLAFCHCCNLPIYQKDDPQKFMVFACRSCGLEEPDDYSFTLEKKMINGISVLPEVKNQKSDGIEGLCIPTALLTVLEVEIKTTKAELREEFNQNLSMNDFLTQYEQRVGCSYESDTRSDYDDSRAKTLMEILLDNGVPLKNDPVGGEIFKATEVHHLKNQSFHDLAGHILKGHPLLIKMPMRSTFYKMKKDSVYIARAKTKDEIKHEGYQMWHAVVLVGFGRKDGVEYFRFMNSHGKTFADEGFAYLRASEITDAFLVKI